MRAVSAQFLILDTKLIHVLVVEDHHFVRDGLVRFLDDCEGISGVGAAANGESAIVLCGALHPDVVLMDLDMPNMDGVTATTIIPEKYPTIRVVILTGSFGNSRKKDAFAAGASAYLQKGTRVTDIADTIRSVVR